MTLQKNWYLGFLGLIGLYKLPQVMDFFGAGGSWWDLAGALWLFWFLFFIPEDDPQKADDGA
ncbi:MAG: hypothetical protein JJ920_03620 [Roseitalea sp.]|jgi:hypothetical protein|nr:hypothetical protein [Roseitalea sp.]MBO6722414.1 hypothetical protein [Roseitalea sp.]MBO6741972.1 hypothetical protein [Roseitalea sp.]